MQLTDWVSECESVCYLFCNCFYCLKNYKIACLLSSCNILRLLWLLQLAICLCVLLMLATVLQFKLILLVLFQFLVCSLYNSRVVIICNYCCDLLYDTWHSCSIYLYFVGIRWKPASQPSTLVPWLHV